MVGLTGNVAPRCIVNAAKTFRVGVDLGADGIGGRVCHDGREDYEDAGLTQDVLIDLGGERALLLPCCLCCWDTTIRIAYMVLARKDYSKVMPKVVGRWRIFHGLADIRSVLRAV